MALNVGTLSAKLGLDSTSFLAGMGGAKAALLGLGAVAAVAGLAVKAVFDIGAEVDDARDAIRIGTGAMGDNLDDLLASAQAIGEEVPRNLDEIAPALADVNTRLGLTGDTLETVTAQFLELARMNGSEVGPEIEAGTRLFGDWGVAAEDVSGRLDQIFKVSQNTGIGTAQLTQLTTDYGATLRGLGFDLDGSLALMGKWEQEGVNTEAILGGMKIGLKSYPKTSNETQGQKYPP